MIFFRIFITAKNLTYHNTNTMGTIIYILGIIVAIWCVLDIFKKPKLDLILKILLAIAVLATSWIGFLVYYFLIRNRI